MQYYKPVGVDAIPEHRHIYIHITLLFSWCILENIAWTRPLQDRIQMQSIFTMPICDNLDFHVASHGANQSISANECEHSKRFSWTCSRSHFSVKVCRPVRHSQLCTAMHRGERRFWAMTHATSISCVVMRCSRLHLSQVESSAAPAEQSIVNRSCTLYTTGCTIRQYTAIRMPAQQHL